MSPVIIDCHCHAGPGDGKSGPLGQPAPLGRYLRRAAAAGITRTVVFSTFSDDYAAANRAIAGIVARMPERLLGFAFVHPVHDRGRVDAVVGEAVRVHGFAGIKVHRHDGAITREICEAARRYRVPVLYDVMGRVGQIPVMASAFPDVAFIIPHLSSFGDDWRAQQAFIPMLARLPNVFTDTAGVRRFDLLAEAVRRAGPGKILFGSDGPWLHPGLELAKIRALELAAADERRVLGGNLLRLVSRPRPAGSATETAGAFAASGEPGR